MSNVFISYSHDGKESSRLAEWLRAELKQRDHEAFIYKQDVPLGVEWGRFIDEQLAKCDLLIALLSENSIRSANVIEEIQIDDATLSPFNIGLHAPLEPFDLKECLRLNARFEKYGGKSLNQDDVKRLWDLLRGQPYLTHEAIHAVVTRRISSVTRLIETAADDDGPFADHLRSLLKRISHRSDYNLSTVFKRIIENDAPNDQQAIGRLKAAGLVRIENGRALPANQLYARFFGQMLGQMLGGTL